MSVKANLRIFVFCTHGTRGLILVLSMSYGPTEEPVAGRRALLALREGGGGEGGGGGGGGGGGEGGGDGGGGGGGLDPSWRAG